jgi:hypothetical protein
MSPLVIDLSTVEKYLWFPETFICSAGGLDEKLSINIRLDQGVAPNSIQGFISMFLPKINFKP